MKRTILNAAAVAMALAPKPDAPSDSETADASKPGSSDFPTPADLIKRMRKALTKRGLRKNEDVATLGEAVDQYAAALSTRR